MNEIALESAPAVPITGDASAVPSSGGRVVLIRSISWTVIGTLFFFGLHFLMTRWGGANSNTGTLMSAFLSGGAGIFIATLWLRKFPGYRAAQLAILGSYVLRVLVGILIYLCVMDPGYFGGDGVYPYSTKYREFHWTYTQSMYAASILTGDTKFLTRYFIPMREDKNANIHFYMGFFMAAGGSRHALDITPLNSFHHAVAGILIIGLALACGYSPRVSLLSGAVAAWIPWAFAASLMWRDSVGLAWVVMAVVLLCLGKEYGIFGSMLSVIPAGFLAWSDRTPYLVAILFIAVLTILYDRPKRSASGPLKMAGLIFVLMLLVPVLFKLWPSIHSAAMGSYHLQGSRHFLAFRFLVSPLLILRALTGPWPWFFTQVFDWYTIFDYAFHVFQLAIIIILVLNWRAVIAHTNMVTYSAVTFWVIAFIGGGVHTSYLAVAAPFWIILAVNTEYKLWKFMILSASAFIFLNVFYLISGLHGTHWIMDITGG